MCAGMGQFGLRVIVCSRREEDPPRGDPPVRIAGSMHILPFVFQHVVGDFVAIDMCDEARCEGQLVALAGQGQGFELPARKESERIALSSTQVVRAVAGQDVLNQAFLYRARRQPFLVRKWYGRYYGVT